MNLKFETERMFPVRRVLAHQDNAVAAFLEHENHETA